MREVVQLATAFRNHSHNVCIMEIVLNDEAYPKEELLKTTIDPNAGQRITLQKDDRLNIRLYKVKVPGCGRKYFNYTIEPRDIVLSNASGKWPREVPIALDVANLKYVINRLYELYCETTRKRYGQFEWACDERRFDASLGGYPVDC
jgi:hypothetical protein